MAAPGLGDASASENVLEDGLLALGDHRADLRHLVGDLVRDRDHAVGIAEEQVAWAHLDAADRDRPVDVGDLHPVLAGAHEPAPAVDRVRQAEGPLDVAADAVDDRARHTALVGHGGEDVAPDRAVNPAAVVEHDDAARRHVV